MSRHAHWLQQPTDQNSGHTFSCYTSETEAVRRCDDERRGVCRSWRGLQLSCGSDSRGLGRAAGGGAAVAGSLLPSVVIIWTLLGHNTAAAAPRTPRHPVMWISNLKRSFWIWSSCLFLFLLVIIDSAARQLMTTVRQLLMTRGPLYNSTSTALQTRASNEGS